MKCDVNDLVLYHPALSPSLGFFGFEVPLADNRSETVFKRLREDFPSLKPYEIEKLIMFSYHLNH